jgi:type II secretory pathway component GspD/PulD (secretin)
MCLFAACHHPLVRGSARAADSTVMLDESPLLVDLPPDEPEPALHVEHGALRLADDTLYTLHFRGTDVRVALAEIAARADVTLIVGASVTGTVDVDFVDLALDDALATLLRQHDLVVLPGPKNVYFVDRNDDSSLVTEFIHLRNVRAVDVAPNLTALVGGTSKILTDNDRNLVCLVGRLSDVAAVRRYLQHVDTLKDQVLLEVHIFEVSYEDGFALGAISEFDGSVDGNPLAILSSFGQASDFSMTLSDDDGDFASTIDAVRRLVGLELVSSPRVLAVTNTKAIVDVVQELPYVEVTATTTGTTAGIGSTVQESVEFKDAGIKLEITPSIQEAGYIQIDILQQIIQEIGRFNDIPVVDRRTLSTQFLVKNKETIVLGGLIQNRERESRTGVPFLMHIPILGALFRGDNDLKKKQEILIFVTPRILSPSQAAKLAGRYRQSYRESRQDLTFPTLGGIDG